MNDILGMDKNLFASESLLPGYKIQDLDKRHLKDHFQVPEDAQRPPKRAQTLKGVQASDFFDCQVLVFLNVQTCNIIAGAQSTAGQGGLMLFKTYFEWDLRLMIQLGILEALRVMKTKNSKKSL